MFWPCLRLEPGHRRELGRDRHLGLVGHPDRGDNCVHLRPDPGSYLDSGCMEAPGTSWTKRFSVTQVARIRLTPRGDKTAVSALARRRPQVCPGDSPETYARPPLSGRQVTRLISRMSST
jgi:hypothetical protein